MTMEDPTVAVPTLGEVIAVLKEITNPHLLGIHLGIEDHQLDKFETNFPRDVDRQTIEVIKHWKKNHKDCSWSSLATAVENMGKHANLVTTLRELHIKAIQESKVNNTVDGITAKKDHESDCPTLKELKEYVWKSVGEKWEELAIALGLDEDDGSKKKLDGIRERRKGNASMASYDVLHLWQSNERANPSWEKLIKALNTAGLLDAVKSIRDYLACGIEVKDKSSSVALRKQCSTSTNQEKIPTTKHYTLQMKAGQKVRNYQHELALPGKKGENYIVVAPTNSGKTLVAALVIANHLETNPLQRRPPKVIMVVKTRPLADQQREKLREYIPDAIVECRMGNRGDYQERQQQLHIKDALHHSDVIVCTAGKLRDELKREMVTLQDFSLMIIDECHNTEKGSNYAQIMYMYLEQKTGGGSQLPQVMGLTATPGIGKNPGLNAAKAVDNLLNLCANMDASSGIQTVQQHVDELAQVLHKPEYYQDVVDQSEGRQVFIQRVEEEMKGCEKFLNFDFVGKLPRWSQKYEHAVKEIKSTLEENENPDDRDKISTIRLLECYSQTLINYVELPCVQAMLPLEKYDDLTTSDKLSDHENCLLQKFIILKSDLASLDLCENPILEKLQERLTNTFKRKPESEGIVFVRTREQAEAISDWIRDSKFAEMLNIRSHMLLGHNKTDDKGPSMSDEEQKMVVEAFHTGCYNLLIATSVAEEGLDIKQCNLVMRLHISSAKSKAQMQGRARADDSEIVTIMSNDPRTRYRDMLNDEQLLLMERLIRNRFLPQHEILQEKIATIQVALRDSIRRQRELQESQMSTHPAQNVELKCKKCKITACRGSDIYIIDKTNHHVVPGDALCYELVEHSTPGMLEGCGYMNIKKRYKIHCTGCNASWGVLGTWPSKKEFPVLKCDCFNFYVNGRRSNFTKWKDRPFKVSPLSEWFAKTNQL